MWIIGKLQPELPQNVLPTKKDVLKTFCFYHSTLKKGISESANLTADQLINLWNNAHLKTSFKTYIVTKIKKMYKRYVVLQKSIKSKLLSQKMNRKQFIDTLKTIFDIAHSKVESLLRSKNHKTFLADQRDKRLMTIENEPVSRAEASAHIFIPDVCKQKELLWCSSSQVVLMVYCLLIIVFNWCNILYRQRVLPQKLMNYKRLKIHLMS